MKDRSGARATNPATSRRSAAGRRRVVVVTALSLAGAALFLAGRGLLTRDGGARALDLEAAAPESEAARAERLAPAALEAGAPAPAAAGRSQAVGEAPAPQARDPHAGSRLATFTGRFVDARRRPLRLERARVTLTDRDGVERVVEPVGSEEAHFTGLALDRFEARVEAEGFLHRAQTFDLASLQPEMRRGAASLGRGPGFVERLYLFPEGWIPVVVRLPDDRPFSALADELGVEPRRLFVRTFDVVARRDAPDEDAWGEPEHDPPASFHPPSGHQVWELPGACIGTLELHEPPPLWAGLALMGAPLAWQPVLPGAEEVVFRLDLAQLRARLSGLRLRVVSAADGAPLPDARVTARADTSAYRRQEHHDVAPDAQGVVALRDMVPGLYELVVSRAGAVHQDRVLLPTGRVLDLGTIELGDAAGIPVVVRRHLDGEGVQAWLQLGPWREEGFAADLYPPAFTRHTDHEGRSTLPLPSAPSIVRATVMDPVRHHATGERSEDVLVDPAAPPSELRLVVRHEVSVRFARGAPGAVAVVARDAVGLRAAQVLLDAREPVADLLPGVYTLRSLDADGAVLAEARLEVPEDPPKEPFDVVAP